MNAEKENKNCGRPAGRRKTAKIEIAIEPDVKDEFMAICYEEGRNASTQLYQYIRDYIKMHRQE
jgi:hypothetical protein